MSSSERCHKTGYLGLGLLPMSTHDRNFPKLTDPLGETLHKLRLHGSLYCWSELSAPWGIDMPVFDGKMMFHIVTTGQCWLKVQGQDSQLLKSGSLTLLPHGQGHTIVDTPSSSSTDLFDIPIHTISERYEALKYGGGGEVTELICGVVSFDYLANHQFLKQLPKVIHVDEVCIETNTWLQSSLQMIAQEASELKPGGETIITHLADIIILKAIRVWLESAPEANNGWLAALRDQQIGKALLAIHRSPEKDWTVDSLAREVGMSRSGFSARFSQLIGESAKRYLTQWRMQVAQSKIKDNVPLGILAEELGYNSEAAFCRAFKRIMGVSPGSIRSK